MCWTREKLDSHDAAALRREICGLIRAYALPDGDIAAAELIVGEVLSNIVRYAPGRMCADLDWRGSEPTLVVHDSGPGFERSFSDRPSEDDETGRGLNIIRAFSRNVCAERGEFGGTRLVATLPVSRSGELPDAPCPYDWPVRSGRSCPFPNTPRGCPSTSSG